MLAAQETGSAAADVYQLYARRVVKIQSVEDASGAKAAIGSGFFVSPDGHVITNYHVISQLVHHPDRYHAELIDPDNVTRPVEVLAIDVVHDLAVLQTKPHGDPWFLLEPVTLPQGTRLYSLGHPLDLGLSIVEGTYNGLLEHTLYAKIHFTGSINPGMSGGPAITGAGRVVGINVSTAGEQVSFLVPVSRAVELLAKVRAPGYEPPDSLLATVAEQLLAYQDAYLAPLLADSTPTVTLGEFVLPTKPAPFFKCWGDASRSSSTPYETVEHQCSTDDYVFLSGDQTSGIIEFSHKLLTTDELNRFQFYTVYSQHFAGGVGLDETSDDEVTPFRCQTGNVRRDGLTLKVIFCARRYRKLPGLYDAVLKAATLGEPETGLLTILNLYGVSFENAHRLAEWYLGCLARSRP